MITGRPSPLNSRVIVYVEAEELLSLTRLLIPSREILGYVSANFKRFRPEIRMLHKGTVSGKARLTIEHVGQTISW